MYETLGSLTSTRLNVILSYSWFLTYENQLKVLIYMYGVCRRRGLKVNAGRGKMKVMTLNREEGLECEVHVDGIRFEQVSDFKYLRYVLDEAGVEQNVVRR